MPEVPLWPDSPSDRRASPPGCTLVPAIAGRPLVGATQLGSVFPTVPFALDRHWSIDSEPRRQTAHRRLNRTAVPDAGGAHCAKWWPSGNPVFPE